MSANYEKLDDKYGTAENGYNDDNEMKRSYNPTIRNQNAPDGKIKKCWGSVWECVSPLFCWFKCIDLDSFDDPRARRICALNILWLQYVLTVAIIVFSGILVVASGFYLKLVLGITNSVFAALLKFVTTFDQDFGQIVGRIQNFDVQQIALTPSAAHRLSRLASDLDGSNQQEFSSTDQSPRDTKLGRTSSNQHLNQLAQTEGNRALSLDDRSVSDQSLYTSTSTQPRLNNRSSSIQ